MVWWLLSARTSLLQLFLSKIAVSPSLVTTRGHTASDTGSQGWVFNIYYADFTSYGQLLLLRGSGWYMLVAAGSVLLILPWCTVMGA
jgi:hypothetical protein